MRWLTGLPRFLFLLPLVYGGIMLCSCAKISDLGAVREHRHGGTASAEGDTDRACSYFYFLWGRHAELLLQFEEALEAYQKALICDEQAEYISEKVPLLLLRLERTDEAVIWLHSYLNIHPEKTGMRMLYAKVLLKQKKIAEAMRQYQLISERHPNDPAILLLLSEMYISDQQIDKARALLERVLTLDASSYPAHILLARICLVKEEIEEASNHYQKALERNWSSELQMEFAELYIKVARFDKAEALYQEITQRDEQNEGARIALIHVSLLQKKEAQALVELNKLKAYADQPQRVDLTIARLYAKRKQYDKAIAISEKILEKEDLSEARYLLAILLTQQERYTRALKQVRLIDRKAPEYPDALFLQVRILRVLNRFEEARQLLEENIGATEIRSAEMYIMLAALYQSEGKEELSKKVLLQGLDIFPNDENLLYEYGLLLENSGEHTAALGIMQKIIELKPDNAAALNFVGFSWADKKVNLDKALDYIRRAMEIKPENGYIRDSLGWVYYRLGKLDQATVELEAAAKLSPNDGAILDHLGDVYLASGRVREALQTYRKAVKSLSESPAEKKRVQEKVRILERQGTH